MICRNQGPDLAGRAGRQDHDPRDQVRTHDATRPSSPTCASSSRCCRTPGARPRTHRTTSTSQWAALRTINEKLWDIEDLIRDKERARTFDQEFIELARAVYVTNDERAAVKRDINTRLGSKIVEEKSYAKY